MSNPGKRKGILVNLLVIPILTLGVLAGLEIAARALTPPPPENIHECVEQFEAPAKQPGAYRIVAVGESTVNGWPMPEYGCAAQLEAALRRAVPDRPIEVINLGYLGKSSEYVRRMAERYDSYEPDLLLVMSGHNEYLNRTGEDQSVRARLRRALLHLASVRYAVELRQKRQPPPLSPNFYIPERLAPYDRTSWWFQERMNKHRENLAAVTAWARRRGIPVVLCTLPANLADWPPVYRLIAWASDNPHYDADVRRVQVLLSRGDTAGAKQAVDEVLARYGDDAMMLYLKGQACRLAGETAEAYSLFVRAKDLDPFPQRALTPINENIRALADGQGVFLADVQQAFEAKAPDRLVGWGLMADNVHPTNLGYALIAKVIAGTMAQHGLFLDEAALARLPDTPEEWLQTYLDGISSRGHKQWVALKIAIGHSKYCQKYPFFFFERALEYQREVIADARALNQDHWGYHGELGTLLILNERTEEGIAELKLATTMKGSPLDPNDHGSVNWLPEALAKANITLDSLNSDSPQMP